MRISTEASQLLRVKEAQVADGSIGVPSLAHAMHRNPTIPDELCLFMRQEMNRYARAWAPRRDKP